MKLIGTVTVIGSSQLLDRLAECRRLLVARSEVLAVGSETESQRNESVRFVPARSYLGRTGNRSVDCHPVTAATKTLPLRPVQITAEETAVCAEFRSGYVA